MYRINDTGLRLLAFLFVLLLPFPAAAQSRPRRVSSPENGVETTADEGSAVTLEAAMVEVPVVVADRSGRYIPDLTANDFTLYEDGKRQRIVDFRSERVPIHVALLLDTSSSTHDSLDEIQSAAIDFLPQLHPEDRVMVLSFDGDLHVEQEFTNDRRRLERAIEHTKTRKGTKVYDSVVFAVAERLKSVDGRKAVILLSDGDDTRSDSSFDEAVAVCVESDAAVYGIRYPNSSGKSFGIPLPGGKKGGWIPRLPGIPKIPGVNWPLASHWAGGSGDFMEVVTHDTGGRLYEARSVGDMRRLFAAIAEELRHVYVIGYSPENAVSNGGFRSISVKVSEPDLIVRHRMGYKADPRGRTNFARVD